MSHLTKKKMERWHCHVALYSVHEAKEFMKKMRCPVSDIVHGRWCHVWKVSHTVFGKNWTVHERKEKNWQDWVWKKRWKDVNSSEQGIIKIWKARVNVLENVLECYKGAVYFCNDATAFVSLFKTFFFRYGQLELWHVLKVMNFLKQT